jgi:hypothetical protein
MNMPKGNSNILKNVFHLKYCPECRVLGTRHSGLGGRGSGVSQMIMDTKENIHGCGTTSFKHF